MKRYSRLNQESVIGRWGVPHYLRLSVTSRCYLKVAATKVFFGVLNPTLLSPLIPYRERVKNVYI